MSAKHHVLVLDQDLCTHKDGFQVIFDAFKSCLILANHFAAEKKEAAGGTISFCVGHFQDASVEIRPLLTQLSISPMTIREMLSCLELFKPTSVENYAKARRQELFLCWPETFESLSPFIDFPSKEGYHIALITCRQCIRDSFSVERHSGLLSDLPRKGWKVFPIFKTQEGKTFLDLTFRLSFRL